MASFQVTNESGAVRLKVPSQVDGAGVVEVETEAKAWEKLEGQIFVLDFKGVHVFSPKAFRPLLMFSRFLRAQNKALACISVPSQILADFKQHGVDTVLPSFATLEEAVAKFKTVSDPEKTRNATAMILNAVVEATGKVFKTQMSTELKSQKPYLKGKGPALTSDLAAIMHIKETNFHGSLVLCFSEKVFLQVYEKLLGETLPNLTPEAQDGAAELLNIIFGTAKSSLNDKGGFQFQPALPTILTGENLKIRHQSVNPALILPFEGAVGSFFIELSIDGDPAKN